MCGRYVSVSSDADLLTAFDIDDVVDEGPGPSWNVAPLIGETIASVQAQTLTDWELLIADDCSTDQTAAIVESHAANDPRIKLIRQPRNGGPALARQAAIEQATGRFVARPVQSITTSTPNAAQLGNPWLTSMNGISRSPMIILSPSALTFSGQSRTSRSSSSRSE